MSRNSNIFNGIKVQKSFIPPFAPLVPVSASPGSIFIDPISGDATVRVSSGQNLIIGGGTPPNNPVYYVSVSGSDSNSGSLTKPFLTFRKAFETATANGWVNTATIQFLAGTFQIGDDIPLIYGTSPGSRKMPLVVQGTTTQTIPFTTGSGSVFNSSQAETVINYAPGGLTINALTGKFLHFSTTSSNYFKDTYHVIVSNTATTISVSSASVQVVTAADSYEVLTTVSNLVTDSPFLLVTGDIPVIFKLLNVDSGGASFSATASFVSFQACVFTTMNTSSNGFMFNTSRTVFGDIIRLTLDQSNQIFSNGVYFNGAVVLFSLSLISAEAGSFISSSTLSFQNSRLILIASRVVNSQFGTFGTNGFSSLCFFTGQLSPGASTFSFDTTDFQWSDCNFVSCATAIQGTNSRLEIQTCSFSGCSQAISGQQSDLTVGITTINTCTAVINLTKNSRINLQGVTGTNAGATGLVLQSGSNGTANATTTVTGADDFKVGANAAVAPGGWAALAGSLAAVTSDFANAAPQYCTLQSA